jgi:hypothetical protein
MRVKNAGTAHSETIARTVEAYGQAGAEHGAIGGQ